MLSSSMSAQQFSIHFAGEANYFSKTIVPIINQTESYFTNNQYIGLKYDHIFKNDKLYLSVYVFRYTGSVGFISSEPYFGFGASNGPVYRMGSSIGWNLLNNSRFKIIPNANFIYQWPYQRNGFGVTERGGLDPTLHLPFAGTRYLDALDNSSVLLGPGLDIIYNPWWRINLVFSSYYSFGFVPFAKFYLEYTYNGIPQPRGEWSADGTGFFYSVGAGFKLGKLVEKKAKKKSRKSKKKK